MAGQIGELIVKTGHYPSFGIMAKAGEIVKHHNGEYTTNHDVFVIRQNNIKASYHNVSPSIAHQGIQSEIINYSGMVWDVELEKYHILFVRKKRKNSVERKLRPFPRCIHPGAYGEADKRAGRKRGLRGSTRATQA